MGYDILVRIRLILHHQIQKYRMKGIANSIISWVLLLILFYLSRQIAVWAWPHDLSDADKPVFVLKASLIIHFTCELTYFLMFLPGYLDVLPFYRKYLIQPVEPRPWQRKDWHAGFLSRSIKIILFNTVFIYILLIVIGLKMGSLKFKFEGFPSYFQLISTIFTIFWLQDLFQCVFHKMFHEVKVLANLHKIHHEYNRTFTMVAEHSHPIDYLCMTLPTSIAFAILGGSHAFIFLFWQIFKIFTSRQSHSGYDFPWMPIRVMPFVASSSYHDYHHWANSGNYAGSVYAWDTLFGWSEPWNKEYLDHLDKLEANQKYKYRKAE